LIGSAAIVPALCVPGTTVLRASVLAIWADTLAGLVAVDVVQPRVPVTLQLDVNLYDQGADVEQIHATARPLKVGRSVIVASVDFADGNGELLAAATGTFMVAPDPNVTFSPGPDMVGRMDVPGGPLRVPLADRAGCKRRGPGMVALERTAEGTNASSTLNGGLLALAVEEAALSAGDGTPLAMIAMRYLRPVRVGPALAIATVRAGLGTIEVRDEGRDQGLSVLATTRTFRS
jgi:acyl-coenzyme A thioesterase PaaI-like protein